MPLLLAVTLLVSAFAIDLYAQTNPYSAGEIQQRLRKLATVGSVLHIAAHPDDENTLLLAYFAQERNLRTGYLSLTRGEGGQNLIGTEQGIYLGLIRTQELLAARRIDGAEQYFSRATDFGFSKTPEETLSKWGREQVLHDVVWVIRRFRPDVIFLRFSGTAEDGHGQHQSSALLAKEAFAAAADPARFPEQLRHVKPYQAKRLFFNLFNFTAEMEAKSRTVAGSLSIEAGGYNPLLGLSYGEIEGRSRSQHASQAMGWPQRRASRLERLKLVAGDPATKEPFDGIDLTWKRVPGGERIGAMLAEASRRFDPAHPETILPQLLALRPLVAAVRDEVATGKLRELDELITACAGIWVDASAGRPVVTGGASLQVQLEVVQRLPAEITLVGAALRGMATAAATWKDRALQRDERVLETLTVTVPPQASVTQPFWLRQPMDGTLYSVPDRNDLGKAENEPELTAEFRFRAHGVEFTAVRPVQHRYVDVARGELTRPLVVAPPVAVEFSEAALVFGDGKPREITVTVKANRANAAGHVRLEAGAGWRFSPETLAYKLQKESEQTALRFTITPPAAESTVTLRAIAIEGGEKYSLGMRVISYPHIPPVTVFPEASARLVRADIKILSRNVGYVMGAGDQVPESLRQLGIEVAMLSDEDLATGDLARFDALVLGVRAFNTRPSLRANRQRLLDYMTAGGTLVVQYNVLEGYGPRPATSVLDSIGPYPLTIGRGRVTVEDSPVNLSSHKLLSQPNAISKKDFEGWVQERGLYFAEKFDERYTSLFSTQDPGEDWRPGGMLVTQYGKGAFVFTGYSWFRQLPAGVPGAYRIFANLISAGKVQ